MAELVKMSLSNAGLMNAARDDALHPVVAAISSVHRVPVKYYTSHVSANAASAAATGRVAISRKSCSADMFSFIGRLLVSSSGLSKVARAVGP